MADTTVIPTPMATDGLFGAGGGGLIGGLILGSLLRNNGNLFGGDGAGAGAAAALTTPLIQQTLGDIKAAIPLAESQTQTAIANSQNAVQQSVFGAQTVTQAGFSAQAQNLNQIENNILRETTAINAAVANVDRNLAVQTGVIQQTITNDGDKTRALLTSQYEATLNRQLADANARIVALENARNLDGVQRGVEVNTTNNINQMQQQQQQQQQYHHLANLIWGLGQQIRSTNEAINVGTGTLTANPVNTNTNIR